jgi:hypothetical protein
VPSSVTRLIVNSFGVNCGIDWCLAPDARKNPVLSKLIYGDTINVWQHLKRNTRRLIKLPGIASDNNNPCATICPGRSLAGLSGCD